MEFVRYPLPYAADVLGSRLRVVKVNVHILQPNL